MLLPLLVVRAMLVVVAVLLYRALLVLLAQQ